jgi:hypothetical protein
MRYRDENRPANVIERRFDIAGTTSRIDMCLEYVRQQPHLTINGDTVDDYWVLSITGHDAHGHGGQCQEEMLKNYGADHPMVASIISIWQRWHLNNMNPACVHQVKEGWSDNTVQLEVVKYKLNSTILDTRRYEEKRALTILKSGAGMTAWEPEILKIMNLPYGATAGGESQYVETRKELLKYYDECKREMIQRNMVPESDHPAGLLSKKCPVCKYSYGSAWLLEPLPQAIILELMVLFGITVEEINKAEAAK